MGPSNDQKTAMAIAICGTGLALVLGLLSLLFTGTIATIIVVVPAVITLVNMFILSTLSPSYNGGGKVVLGFISLPLSWLTVGFFMTGFGFVLYAVGSIFFYAVVCLLTSRR
ncbi:MAG: hypothetical protein K2X93_19075 [Candidatus Obscuribacterales bacterium]|nr:hypothetical protein [Candidatus Obscuribacterales bacterium]